MKAPRTSASRRLTSTPSFETPALTMRALHVLLATSVITGATLGAPSSAHGQQQPPAGTSVAPSAGGREQAKRLFDEGLELEKKSDFAGALAKYARAEQITVTPGLRFHKGYCLEMTGKLLAAIDDYEAADTMAVAQNKPEVHAAVTVRLEPLRVRLPHIAIRLATPAKDANVHLDGVAVAPDLLEGKSFKLDPGEHSVTANAPGFQPFKRKVLVQESVTTTVDVSLDRLTRPRPVAAGGVPAASSSPSLSDSAAAPPERPRAQRSAVLPIATTAGAVILAGAGVASFLVAGGAASDADQDCPAKMSCEDERSRVRTFDALALGAFVGAAGLGVLSVVLWATRSPAETAWLRLLPSASRARLVATPQSMGIEGTFQ